MCLRVCPAQLVQLAAAGVFAAFSDWLMARSISCSESLA